MPPTYRNFIAGEHAASSSGNTIEVRNPTDTDEVIGLVPASTVEDAQAAIAAAHAAFPKWAGLTGPERGKIFYRAANILETQLDSWAIELTREEGKTKLESPHDGSLPRKARHRESHDEREARLQGQEPATDIIAV